MSDKVSLESSGALAMFSASLAPRPTTSRCSLSCWMYCWVRWTACVRSDGALGILLVAMVNSGESRRKLDPAFRLEGMGQRHDAVCTSARKTVSRAVLDAMVMGCYGTGSDWLDKNAYKEAQ